MSTAPFPGWFRPLVVCLVFFAWPGFAGSSGLIAKPLEPSQSEEAWVQSTEDSSCFLVRAGRKRLVTPFVLKQYGRQRVAAQTMEANALNQIPSDPALPPKEGTLVKSEEASTVFLVDQGQLRSVSRFVFQQRKFKNSAIAKVPKAELDQWPGGKPLPPPDGILVRGAARPAVYLIQEGKRYWVDLDVFKVRKFEFKDVLVIPDAELEGLEYHELDFPSNALIRLQADPTVFLFRNGMVLGINPVVFTKCNFQFQEVQVVSPSRFKTYPRGPDLTEAGCPSVSK
jgi:hypothetical protein